MTRIFWLSDDDGRGSISEVSLVTNTVIDFYDIS